MEEKQGGAKLDDATFAEEEVIVRCMDLEWLFTDYHTYLDFATTLYNLEEEKIFETRGMKFLLNEFLDAK